MADFGARFLRADRKDGTRRDGSLGARGPVDRIHHLDLQKASWRSSATADALSSAS